MTAPGQVLVPATPGVPLPAVSAAAVDVCGREAVRLDTGGPVVGIRVPAALAGAVRARAELMAGVADEPVGPLATAPVTHDMGRPACGPSAAAQRPASGAPRSQARQASRTTSEGV